MACSESESELVARRFRVALELHEAGVAMMRQNLRRRYPQDPASEIERRLQLWLQTPSQPPIGRVRSQP